jgi:hypothetical protein
MADVDAEVVMWCPSKCDWRMRGSAIRSTHVEPSSYAFWVACATSVACSFTPAQAVIAMARILLTGSRPAGARCSYWLLVSPCAGQQISVCLAGLDVQRPTGRRGQGTKAKVCAAFDKVQHAVMATSARSGGDDPTAILAVATSGRQALEVGSRYLLTKLAEEPATPTNLADIVRRVANLYQERTIDYLAEVSDAEIDQLRRVSDETTSMVERLCK